MKNPQMYCYHCMAKLSEPGQICPSCGHDNTQRNPGTGNLSPMLLGGQYIVGRALGSGGFGVTYIGWDVNLDCKVAIKEYRPTEIATRSENATELLAYEGQEEAFIYGKKRALLEGRTMAKMISLPNVVKIYNVFEIFIKS